MADDTLTKTEKILNLSNHNAIKQACDSLKNCTVSDLKNLTKYLFDSLAHTRYVAIDVQNNKYVPDAIKLCTEKKQYRKSELLDFASLFFTEDNLHLYLEALPDNIRALWIAAANKIFVSEEEANKLLGEECIDSHRWKAHLCGTLDNGIFDIVYSGLYDYNYDVTYYLTFNYLWLRELIYKYTHHTLANCETAQLPDGLATFNAEVDLFQEIPLLNSLRDSDMLILGKTHFITAKLRKVLDNVNINNFNLNGDRTNYHEETLRPYYLVTTYLLTCENTYAAVINTASTLQIIQLCVKYLFEDIYYFGKQFLPHITGIKRDSTCLYNALNLMSSLKECLRSLHSETWISIEQLLYQTRCLLEQQNCFSILIQEPTSYYNDISLNLYDKTDDKPIKYDQIITRITGQSIKSVLLALASWGVIEIAYDPETAPDGQSYFTDTLRYVRLTKLGKYVFGETNFYQLPATSANTHKDFELNTDRLLIKVRNPKSSGIFALKKMAMPITPQLYRTDFSAFLKECYTKDEIEKNIELFKKYIADELPQIWTDFFNTMLKRSNALKKVKTSYIARAVNAKDKKLQDIIMHEPKLKQYILRAENYVVLIDQAHLSEVIKILKTYGYTI